MSCTYYSFKGGLFGGDYWCNKNDCRVSDREYHNYCKGYNYTACPIYKKGAPSSGCYITTVTCDILEKKDDCSVLNNLREFRKNILQTNEEYYEILKEYDTIGPLIADSIKNDPNNKELAEGLYNNVLLKINNQIKENNYEKAINNYTIMTLMLINYYGLKKEYNNIVDSNYGSYEYEFDPSLSGHGKKIKRG